MKEKSPIIGKEKKRETYEDKKYVVVDSSGYEKTVKNTIEDAKSFCRNYMNNNNWASGNTWYIFPKKIKSITIEQYGKCIGHVDKKDARNDWI